MAVREPGHVAVGPRALGLDLGRALLTPVRKQPGEQERPVADLHAQAFKRLRQALEGEIRKG